MKNADQPPPLPVTALQDAVIRIVCFRPPEGTDINEHGQAVIRDVLAQKFAVALLKAHTSEQKAVLSELWESITGEKADWGES